MRRISERNESMMSVLAVSAGFVSHLCHRFSRCDELEHGCLAPRTGNKGSGSKRSNGSVLKVEVMARSNTIVP